jgi:SAM-dependent methyltransferase
MFDFLAKELEDGGVGTVLDICCGLGHLSHEMAERGWRAVGIDFSEQMIARAVRHERIDYVLHDINGSHSLPGSYRDVRFDHFIIGRAVHWIEDQPLQSLLAANLAEGGHVIICSSGFSSKTPWLSAYRKLRAAYSHREPKKDLTGREKLARLGFKLKQGVVIEFAMDMTLDALTRHSLSYGRATEMISRDFDGFQRKLADVMMPYMQGTQLRAEVNCIALIYRRVPATE